MRRIVVLGSAGTGKTTLARRLGEVTGSPVICLDAIWQPEWTDRDVPHFRELLTEAHRGEAWISDGNFAAATFDIRIPRATQIVWLEQSRITSSLRSIRRVFQRGESHRIGGLYKVLRFIWRFERINRPLIERHIQTFGPNVPLMRLQGDRQIAAFLANAGEASRTEPSRS